MILTVTLNPLLEKRKIINNSAEVENETSADFFYAGGKGINVSRQLNLLGIKNHALTFMGGKTGKQLRKVLNEEGIEFTFISTKAETRTAEVTIDKSAGSLSTKFEPNPEITDAESNEFIKKIEKMILNCSVVVFSGSSPSKATDKIFAAGIEIAHKYDKIAILDSYGEHFKESIKAGPLIIHTNKDEIEKSLNLNLNNDDDYAAITKQLNNNGIKISFITNADKTTYASKFGFNYKITPPKIKALDSTGSGDAFVAGLIYGLEKSMIFDDFSCIASALGSANAARWDACNVSAEEYEALTENVQIESIGKKVKIIDDSPNYQN